MRIGVVLMNLGGPNREEYVRPFLQNLFQDEHIIKMGAGNPDGGILFNMYAYVARRVQGLRKHSDSGQSLLYHRRMQMKPILFAYPNGK